MADDRLVNVADWDGPPLEDFAPGTVIVNAPRPLAGPRYWTGKFRSGTLYAAGPGDDEKLAESWRRDDAARIVFITNDQIMERLAAKVSGYGYASVQAACDDLGLTVADLAGQWQLPWHDELDHPAT